MSAHLDRAILLLEHGKLDEAEKSIKLYLSEFPNDAHAIAILSFITHSKGDNLAALPIIEAAIEMDPNNNYYHYLHALYRYNLQRLEEAEESIKISIQIDPTVAEQFGLLAAINIQNKKFQEALDIANTGLSHDPKNTFCLNTKSTAQTKLGQEEEAFKTVEGALNEDPEDSYTHTNYGWGLLQSGDVAKALHHFKEALRLKPSNDNARSGMIEALKAKYWLYKKFLQYQFWMQKQSSQFQWGFIIGIYLFSRGLGELAKSNPGLSDFLYPVLYLLMVAAFSTWVITPVSNLFLRINKFGRFALNETETKISNFVGLAVATGIVGIVSFLLLGGVFHFGLIVYGFSMMVPLSGLFNGTKDEKIFNSYAIGMAVIGGLALINIYQSHDLNSQLVTVYIYGFIGYQWLGNILLSFRN